MSHRPGFSRRRSLGLLGVAVLVVALAQPLAASEVAAGCGGPPAGRAAKSEGDAHRAAAAFAAQAAHCSALAPTVAPSPAPAPGPPPPAAPPPVPVLPPVAGVGALLGPATAAGGAMVATALADLTAPPAAALNAPPAAAPLATPPGHGPAAGIPVAKPSSLAPTLAAVATALDFVTRVDYVVRTFQAEVWIELWLLLIALAMFFVAERRRRERARLRVELAASAGVSASALRGVPAGAAAALLVAVKGLADRSERLVRDAVVDELTGVYRRGPGMDALRRDVARAERALVPVLAVAMVDVDGLKAVNDSAGHVAGDDLLRTTAAAITGRLRGQDLVFRYGGDEFVCVFPNTDASVAWRLLDAIAAGLSETLGRRAFSFGVGQFRPGDSAEALLERADRALYAARAARR